jgi:tRNA(Ile)-lysidine synthase
MHKFVRSLITEWRKLGLPFANETVILAVSGGADSVSLVLAIHDLAVRKKLSHQFVVAHLNHKLRGDESDADAEFVKTLADRLELSFEVGTANLPKRGNLEQHARDARYEFLSKVATRHGAFAVLTAHTRNDQAETLLFNLIRGSGPEGLAGISPVRQLANQIQLVRPLLAWATRDDTEQFCVQSGVEYRTDSMNSDERFSRVKIRRQILPALAEINPKIVQSLARTADVMRKYAVPDSFGSIYCESPDLVLKDLKELNEADLSEMIRSWLRNSRGNLRSLQLKHIEAVARLVNSRKSGNTVELPGGGRVVKQGGKLRFENIKVDN